MTHLKSSDSDHADQLHDSVISDLEADDKNLAKPLPAFAEPRRPWTLIIGALMLAVGVGFMSGQSWESWKDWLQPAPSEAQERRPPTQVRLTPLSATTVEEKSEFVGNLEAKRAVQVQSEVEGRVIQLMVEAGDFVDRGEVIARIKSDSLEANLRQAQARLVRARARLAELQAGTRSETLEASQARLQQAQARLAQLQAGTRTEELAKARATLLEAQSELDDAQSGSLLEEINQAKAQLAASEADADLARQQVQRNESLSQEGAISQDAFDQYVSDYRVAQARVEEGKRRIDQLQQRRQAEIQRRQAIVEQEQQALRQLENGARPEEIAQAQASVTEARSQFNELLNGSRPEEIAQAEADVAEAVAAVRSYEVQLQETLVLAPFAGMIGDIPVKAGDFLSKGDAITTLTENQVLDLHLPIPLERESQLKMGLPVQMQDAQSNPLGTGRISFISPTVNNESQTILAKATFDNTTGQLRNGQFVKANVVWEQRSQRVKVPMTAVIFQGEKRFVFIAEQGEDGKVAQRVPIELGLIQGDYGEVISGVTPGQLLITSGLQRLSDGVAIQEQDNPAQQ